MLFDSRSAVLNLKRQHAGWKGVRYTTCENGKAWFIVTADEGFIDAGLSELISGGEEAMQLWHLSK